MVLTPFYFHAFSAKAGKAKDEEPVTEAPSFDTDEYSELMDKAVNVLKKDFDKLRTGQVSAGMVCSRERDSPTSIVPIPPLVARTHLVGEPKAIVYKFSSDHFHRRVRSHTHQQPTLYLVRAHAHVISQAC